MGSLSDYAETNVLDHLTGKTAYTKPTIYVGLCTAAPTDASTGATITEVANSNNYSRKSTAGADWNAASAGSVSNANAITFATPSGSWGTASHFVLIDSATYGAGNVIAWGALGSSMGIGANATVSFAAGALTMTLD